MVTHAPLRKESNHNNKDGLPPSGRPGAGWTCQLFKGSNSCWETDPFSWLCSANTSSQSCQRRPWAREGLDLGGKGAASLGLAHRSAHPSRAQADCFFLFFFLTFHTQCAPILPSRVQSLLGEAGAGPTRRSGDSPARVVAAAGRQVREGEAGAARRATRELGGRKGAGPLGRHGGRWPRLSLCGAGCRAATPSTPARATPRAQGASRHRASWAVGVGRAPGPARLSSASGERARRRRSRSAPGRGAPGPYANRKRPRPSRAAAWAGSGRVGGARPRALGLRSGVFSSAESLGALAVTVGGWC